MYMNWLDTVLFNIFHIFIECSSTTWGPDCNKTCGHCKNDMPCSVSIGTCQDACTPGWYPPYCLTGKYCNISFKLYIIHLWQLMFYSRILIRKAFTYVRWTFIQTNSSLYRFKFVRLCLLFGYFERYWKIKCYAI